MSLGVSALLLGFQVQTLILRLAGVWRCPGRTFPHRDVPRLWGGLIGLLVVVVLFLLALSGESQMRANVLLGLGHGIALSSRALHEWAHYNRHHGHIPPGSD